jgi:hypothetical protein
MVGINVRENGESTFADIKWFWPAYFCFDALFFAPVPYYFYFDKL